MPSPTPAQAPVEVQVSGLYVVYLLHSLTFMMESQFFYTSYNFLLDRQMENQETIL